MSRSTKREKATQRADLPHEFDEHADKTCQTCGSFFEDERHTVWVQQEIAAEHLPPMFVRETGS